MNSSAYSRIGAAAANVSIHRLRDFLIAGRGVLYQQRGCGHNLSTLTVATLRDVGFQPRLLDHGELLVDTIESLRNNQQLSVVQPRLLDHGELLVVTQ